MKKGMRKMNPLNEEPVQDLIENEYPDNHLLQPRRKGKRRSPKRDGCLGGGASLAGNPTTSLAGNASTTLAGDAAVSLAGTPGTSLASLILAGSGSTVLPAGQKGVIRSKEAIRKGDIIKAADLEAYVISKPVSSPDMLVSAADVVGKSATVNIPAHTILKKHMVKRPVVH